MAEFASDPDHSTLDDERRSELTAQRLSLEELVCSLEAKHEAFFRTMEALSPPERGHAGHHVCELPNLPAGTYTTMNCPDCGQKWRHGGAGGNAWWPDKP